MRSLTPSTLLLASLVSFGSLESCATTGRARPDTESPACRDAAPESGGESPPVGATDGATDDAQAECARGPFDAHAVRQRWKREQEEQDRDERREAFIHRH